MSYKYTVNIAAVVTTTDEYDALVTKIRQGVVGLGTATLISNISVNQWIDPTNMTPQEFNPDGTPVTPSTEAAE